MPSKKEMDRIAEQFNDYLVENDLKVQIGSARHALENVFHEWKSQQNIQVGPAVMIHALAKWGVLRIKGGKKVIWIKGEVDLAQKIRVLMASSPRESIAGADFKKVYADYFSEELDLRGGKLKDLLTRCEALGACQLEYRPMPKGPASLFVYAVDTSIPSSRLVPVSRSTRGDSDSAAFLQAAHETKIAEMEAEKVATEKILAEARAARAALELKAARAESAKRAAEERIADAEAAKAAAENKASDLKVRSAMVEREAKELRAAALRVSRAKNASEEDLQEEKIRRGELAPVWTCEIDVGQWVKYDETIASKLETEYQARKQSRYHQSNNQPTWSLKSHSYTIDWDFMVQMNVQTQKGRSIRRELVPNAKKHLNASGGSEKQWVSVQEEVLPGNVSCYKIPASSLSESVDSKELDEFNFAAGQLMRLQGCNNHHLGAALSFGGGSRNGGQRVIQVDVYENKALEEQWNSKKQQLGHSACKPFWVFHGTDTANIGQIMREGLKVGGKDGVPITNGSAYGPGVYTAAGPGVPLRYGQSKSVILALGLGGQSGTDSTRPRGDWVIFSSGAQLLPKYVLHMR